jgi:hypothetical protein
MVKVLPKYSNITSPRVTTTTYEREKKGRRGRAVLRLYLLVMNPIMLIITAVNIDIQNISQNCWVSRKRLREKSIKKSPKPNPSLNFLKPYININSRVIPTSSIKPESSALIIKAPLIKEFNTK